MSYTICAEIIDKKIVTHFLENAMEGALPNPDFEDVIINDTIDELSIHGRNYSGLDTIVTNVYENSRHTGIYIHEIIVLVMSAMVVGINGFLGLLPRALFTQILPWELMQWAMVFCGIYSFCCLCASIYNFAFTEIVVLEEDSVDEQPISETRKEDFPEKEDRVKFWVNNLYSNKDQVNFEACGEIKGKNMEADLSTSDLLGDGQPSKFPEPLIPFLAVNKSTGTPKVTTTTNASNTSPLLGVEGQRALSLAYELGRSVAVRNQMTNEIKSSLSYPLSPYRELALIARENTSRDDLDRKKPIESEYDRTSEESESLSTSSSLVSFVNRIGASRILPKTPPPIKKEIHKKESPQNNKFIWESSTSQLKKSRLSVDDDSDTTDLDLDSQDSVQSQQSSFDIELKPPSKLHSKVLIQPVELIKSKLCFVDVEKSTSDASTVTSSADAVMPNQSKSQQNFLSSGAVQKVFSKGLLSEDIFGNSTTSISHECKMQVSSDFGFGFGFGAGALSLPAQEAATLAWKNSQSESETFYSCDQLETLSDGLGLDHKSMFDVRKPQLSSIPEVISLDEDNNHQ